MPILAPSNKFHNALDNDTNDFGSAIFMLTEHTQMIFHNFWFLDETASLMWMKKRNLEILLQFSTI